jgi:hypothetical protein
MIEVQTQELKPMLKKLLHELLMQERNLLKELIYEVMEDIALAKAIAEGKDSENVERNEIFALLDGRDCILS